MGVFAVRENEAVVQRLALSSNVRSNRPVGNRFSGNDGRRYHTAGVIEDIKVSKSV